jgi:hypothetical protein
VRHLTIRADIATGAGQFGQGIFIYPFNDLSTMANNEFVVAIIILVVLLGGIALYQDSHQQSTVSMVIKDIPSPSTTAVQPTEPSDSSTTIHK